MILIIRRKSEYIWFNDMDLRIRRNDDPAKEPLPKVVVVHSASTKDPLSKVVVVHCPKCLAFQQRKCDHHQSNCC